MSSRTVLAAAWLAVCVCTPLRAQTAPLPADSADVLVLDHDFASGGEIVRIFLKDGQVYRAELSSEDVTLELRPRFNGVRAPRVYQITEARMPSGTSVVEVYPDEDAEYEIRPVSIQGSRLSTRLRLYRDVSESRRRMVAVRKPGWELGVELGGGWHSRFAQSSVAPAVATRPSGGTDVEACLSARSAPKLPRFGMCVLGVSHQSQSRAPSVLWVYTEPRLGVLLRDRLGHSSWETGVLLRFGVGINSTTTPKILAPGVFISRHIRKDRQGSGWTLQMSYSRASYKGFSKHTAIGDPVTPTSHRVLFGVGWYR